MAPRTAFAPRLPLGLLLTALFGTSVPLLAGDGALEDRFEKAFELAGVSKVRLENVNGAVHVDTWERAYLRVTAVKKARGARAGQTLRETEIRVSKVGDRIEIETVLPKRGRLFGLFFWQGRAGVDVAYDLLLPAPVGVEVETVNGRITAEKRAGALSLNSVNGSIRVEAHRGPLRVNTVNGSIEASFAGPIRAAELETVNGSVTVAGSRDSSIRCELQTVNGRIQSEFTGLDVEGKWGPREAHGAVNGGRERLSVQTVNGSVHLQVVGAGLAAK